MASNEKVSDADLTEDNMKRQWSWKKRIFVCGLIVLGLCVLAVGGYIYTFVTGMPVVRVDYLEQYYAQVRGDWPEEMNARHDLESSRDKLVDEPEECFDWIGALELDWEELQANERQVIDEWLDDNQEAWEVFAAASEKPYCCIEYERDEDVGESGDDWRAILSNSLFMVQSTGNPPIGHLRYMYKMGVFRVHRACAEDDWTGALADCLTMVRVGKLMLGNGTGVQQQMANIIVNAVSERFIMLIMQPGFPVELLEEAYDSWRELFTDGYPVANCDFLEMVGRDLMQRCFTEGGIGGGHVVVQVLTYWEGREDHSLYYYRRFLLVALKHVRRDEAVAMMESYLGLLRHQAALSPYELYESGEEPAEAVLKDYLGDCAIPMGAFLGWDQNVETVQRSRTCYEAALTVAAIRVYQAEQGEYPESLAELVTEGYLQQWPSDPYSGSGLVYRRDVGDFALYSLGKDFDDDGGLEPSNSTFMGYAEDGDLVFWPVR